MNGYMLLSKSIFNGSWLFLVVLAYPPLVFTDKLSDTLRIFLFFVLTLYLFFKTKILLYRHLVNLSILTTFIVINLFSINFESQLDLSNSASLFLTLAFAIALDRACTNNTLSISLVKFYVFLFTLIPLMMIFTLGWYFFFGELNLHNLQIGEVGSNEFLYTPFGALVPKFTDSVYLRSTSFFHEPVLLAFFLAINTFLSVAGSGFCARNFRKLNFVGGVLTLSYLYFAIVLTLLIWRMRDKFRLNNSLTILYFTFILIALGLGYHALLMTSSLQIRLDRAAIYLSLYPMLSIGDLWLGSGINPHTEFSNAINTGAITLLYKFGIVGLVSIVTLIWMLTHKNILLFIACLFSLFSYEPYLFPLFWLAIISFVAVSRKSFEHVHNSSNVNIGL